MKTRALLLAIPLSIGLGCAPCDRDAIDFTPLPGDWPVSTPEEQGLDPERVTDLYCDAANLEKVQSVLVIKDGYLVAEEYYHGVAVEDLQLMQSVSKSYASALVGIAIDRGCLADVDHRMMDSFPELEDGLVDDRKRQITVRQLLQMRSGYPWEEDDPDAWPIFLSGEYFDLIQDLPLATDPGEAFHYSNLTPYILGIIVSRECGVDLHDFAAEHLSTPIGAGAGEWYQDELAHYHNGFTYTSRDMARLGQLYLDGGDADGTQVISSGWIDDSLEAYSEKTWEAGLHFKDIGYGYQWWNADVGDHRVDFAWGHGGQLIILVHEQEMVIVATSDPFFGQHDDESWKYEKQMFGLVGPFIKDLPAE